MGQEFSLARLSAVLDEEEKEPVRQALDEARKVGIIEEIAESPNRYRFAHKMIQEVAEQEFSITTRAILHERIGVMLEEQYGEDSAKHATELTRHFEQADSDEVGGKIAYYSRLAGEAALAGYSFEEAAAHFSRAADVKRNMPMDVEKAKSLFGLGRAQLALYMLDESLDNLDKAFDHFEKTGDSKRMAAIASSHRLSLFFDRVEGRIISWVERAIKVTPDDSPFMPRLVGSNAYFEYMENSDYEHAENVLRNALDASTRQENHGSAMSIYRHWCVIDFMEGRYDEAYEKGLKLLKLAREANDKYHSVMGSFIAGQCTVYLGEGAASLRH